MLIPDTSVVGPKIWVIYDNERYICVYGHDNKSRLKNISTGDATVGYDDPQITDMSIWFIGQAILIPSIQNILQCQNACSLHKILVNDVPNFLGKNPW